MKSLKMNFILSLFILVITNATAQEITSFTNLWGMEYYQDDNKITKKELNELFSKNEQINTYWKKANTKEVIAGVAGAVQIGLLTWAAVELAKDDPFLSGRDRAKNAIGPTLGSLGAGVISIIFLNGSYKARKNAILQYNKQFDDKTTYRLVPISNQTGIGVALKW